MAMVIEECNVDVELPPGYKFHPTDEEIITHYLSPKVMNERFSGRAMGDVDLNKFEPWDLPSKAKMVGDKEWYFFTQRNRKYPIGMRTNRATEAGYWKATGKDKEIFRGRGRGSLLVGMKKTLVFYMGRAPKGIKSNWVMHEFRLLQPTTADSNPLNVSKDEWVVCRVLHKGIITSEDNKNPISSTMMMSYSEMARINSFSDHQLIFLDSQNLLPLTHSTYLYSSKPTSSTTTRTSDDSFDFGDILTTPPSSYFSNMMDSNLPADQAQTLFYGQAGHVNVAPPNAYFMNPDDDAKGYLHQSGKVQCMDEQLPNNNISVSDDTTGLISTDGNTAEISSVLSRHHNFEDLYLTTAGASLHNLDSLWKC